MKKTFLLLICFFSIGVLSAQEKLSKEEKERRQKNIQAGNPFIKYGSKAPVATLSKGKYLEVHDLDSIVTIGTMRWQVDKKQIVGQIEIDSLDTDAQPIGDAPGRWMSMDPLSEEYSSWSPYNMCFDNPVKFIDKTGMGPDDFIVLNMSGTEISRVAAPGQDQYVKVDQKAYEAKSATFMNDNKDYNTMLTVGALRSDERAPGGSQNLISEQTGVSMTVTGSMREGNDKIGDVNVGFQADFDNGSSTAIGDTYSAVAGGFGNGAPENGAYTVGNFQDRSPSGWFSAGMNRDGVGFSFNLNPSFSTGRTDLRVHPDGNNEGTLGCIGLSGNAATLTSFSTQLQGYLQNLSSIPANINITNNPNNDGRGGTRIPNVNE